LHSQSWASLTDYDKEGSLRSATDYLDSIYGSNYLGTKAGDMQALLWPRHLAKDGQGNLLPVRPRELVSATIELAVRAAAAPLLTDIDRSTAVKSVTETVGPLSTSTTYESPSAAQRSYGVVEGLMARLTSGGQSNGGSPWNWS
jgi:hypothetical protein